MGRRIGVRRVFIVLTSLGLSASKCGDSLDDPEHRHGADSIGRNKLCPRTRRQLCAARQRDERKNDADEEEVSRFNTDAEEAQRGGNM